MSGRHQSPHTAVRPPRRRRRNTTLVGFLAAIALLVGLASPALSMRSSDGIDAAERAALAEQRAEIRAERQARKAQLQAEREARRAARAERQEDAAASRSGRTAAAAESADLGTADTAASAPEPSAESAATLPAATTVGGDTLRSGGEGILLSRAELMALPTSGPGWEAILERIREPYGGSYVLGTRDESNKDVLANALAGARLDNASYKGFVRDRIAHMMAAPRNTGDVLGTLRHLQTYIISADLIDLASFDPALDARFRTWLATEIRADYSGGGGGGSVVSTHEKKPNNFGTHAGATRIAAALYLGDEKELKAARDIWYGWATGDPAYVPDSGRVWTGTSWQCGDGRPYGINPAGCSRDGVSLDGVIPEDQERCGEFSRTPCSTNYVHGATDGMVLSFWMLARQGENPWAWGDRAALRQMQWKYAAGQEPYDGFRWQIPVIEAAYGIELAGNDPARTSTNFGYADWWAQ